MFSYIARRVMGTIPVIILISLLVFMLVQAAPGDPADLLLSDEATTEDVEVIAFHVARRHHGRLLPRQLKGA